MSSMSISKATADIGLLAHEKAPRPPPRFVKGGYEINWVSSLIIALPPLMILAAVVAGYPLMWQTAVVGLIFYFIGGFGITAGYHRLFSHRAYTAHWTLQAALAFAGAGAFQGSVKWWSRNHRIHHRYIDTDKDPYNALRGFFFTHIGWMMMKQDYAILGRVDMSDFTPNKIVKLQHNFYFPIAMVSGILLPTFICGLGWGDWMGGYMYAALFKMVVIHHTTFFINSLAHTPLFGAKQNFSEEHTSTDSFVCAILTLGEGYHNFHHEFAQDYRNGTKWYHYDPTKWVIFAFEQLGLARGLVRTPDEIIMRNYYGVKKDQHHRQFTDFAAKMERLEARTTGNNTEVWTWADINERVAAGRKLVVVGNAVVDCAKTISQTGKRSGTWVQAHPGGAKILEMYVGKDATEAFMGGVYKHSKGAHNMLSLLKVATLKRDYSNQ